MVLYNQFQCFIKLMVKAYYFQTQIDPALNLFYPVHASTNVENNFLLNNSLNTEILSKTGLAF